MSSAVDRVMIPPLHFHNLIAILRHSNRYYHHMAYITRTSSHSTHHARRRAQRLGLTVDTFKAARCDQRNVSVLPLPVLDLTASPTRDDVATLADVEEVVKQSPSQRRPILRCIIPNTLLCTTPNGTTSALTTISSASLSTISLNSVAMSSASMPAQTPAGSANEPVSYWPIDEEDKTFSKNADADIRAVDHAPAQEELARQGCEWRLDVPIDESEMNWDFDELTDTEISPSSVDSSNGSQSASGSSTGPFTPPQEIELPIRLKRKSRDVPDHDLQSSEKRPKYAQPFRLREATARRAGL